MYHVFLKKQNETYMEYNLPMATCFFLSLVEIAVTSLPIAAASRTPICPRPPIPMMPTRIPPLMAPQWERGEYMVMPAHRIGPAASSG